MVWAGSTWYPHPHRDADRFGTNAPNGAGSLGQVGQQQHDLSNAGWRFRRKYEPTARRLAAAGLIKYPEWPFTQ